MDAGETDVHQTVEYSRDKWTMRRAPLALLLCLVGLAFVVHVAPGPPSIGMLTICAGVLAAWLLAKFALILSFEGVTAATRWLALGVSILAFIALGALVAIAPGVTIDYRGRPDLPANLLGWMIIIGSVGWIAAALYRHFVPPRPWLLLSPDGISFRAGITDLLIPWHEVQGVDGLEVTGASGYPQRYADMTVVLVSRALYEQQVLSKRTFMTPPGWNRLFVPKGPLMQVLLPYQWFSIDPRHVREPVEARWKAFRGAPASVPSARRPMPQARHVYGAWSVDGSLWQAMTFLVPVLAIIAILASAPGVWQR